MSDTPFLGELRLMSFNFAPKGWAECNGQFLPINQNQPLFSLLGTMYGGNGQTTFALPDLRARVPIHVGNGYIQGEVLGEESHILSQSEIPAHTHQIRASSTTGNQPTPSILASVDNTYRSASDLTTINPETLANSGGSQAHENRPPYLTLNWCIALLGIFPSRN
jgi:microcystin-dependent protein